jgi:hypothetical protein
VSFPRSPQADKIERMLWGFEPLKNICMDTGIQPEHIRARANRMRLFKHYVTEEERALLLRMRSEKGLL